MTLFPAWNSSPCGSIRCGHTVSICMPSSLKKSGHGMSPVHRPPFGRIWMILIKQMVFTLIVRETIGIIDPSCPSGEVEQSPFLFRNKRHLLFFIISRVAQGVGIHRAYLSLIMILLQDILYHPGYTPSTLCSGGRPDRSAYAVSGMKKPADLIISRLSVPYATAEILQPFSVIRIPRRTSRARRRSPAREHKEWENWQ